MCHGTRILIVALGVLLGGVQLASLAGWGVQRPVKKPVSIREGSVRHGRIGRTRYFMGGGVFRGT